MATFDNTKVVNSIVTLRKLLYDIGSPMFSRLYLNKTVSRALGAIGPNAIFVGANVKRQQSSLNRSTFRFSTFGLLYKQDCTRMKHCDSDQANVMPYQLRQDTHDYRQGTIDTWARNFHA